MSSWLTLTLIAVGIYLFRKPIWRLIWHGVRFFLWRPKALMLVIVAFLCWNTYGIWMAPDAPDVVPPPPPIAEEALPEERNEAESAKKSKFSPVSYPETLPPLPGKAQDGNSRFAANLLQKMNPGELQWYSRIFYHALQSLPEGQAYQWLYQSGESRMFGRLIPGRLDKQGSGITCRTFRELLVVEDKAQQIDGLACQRLEGGWCKLRPGSAKTCEIKAPSGLDGLWFSAKRGLRELF